MKLIVTSQGRITIPKRIRDALNLRPGSKLLLEQISEGEIRLLRCIPGVGDAPDRFEPFHATNELRALLHRDDRYTQSNL